MWLRLAGGLREMILCAGMLLNNEAGPAGIGEVWVGCPRFKIQ